MQRFVRVLWSGILFISTTAWAYSGGTGEPNDPFQIATAQDLIDLGNDPCNYDKCFILTEDIDLSGYVFDRAVIAPDVDSNSYGFQGTNFSGSFVGQGHIISHLSIQGMDFGGSFGQRSDYLALFGYCNSGASISHLGLQVIEVNGTGNSIGGLVGYNSGTITSSYSTGNVNGGNYVGGLVGGNSGSIKSSTCTGNISGYDSVGGLVGSNSGNIISSYSTGNVIGNYNIGGLVGGNSGNIVLSYSTDSVSSDGYVGGLVGGNSGTITSSYSTGDVTSGTSAGTNGDSIVGGLVGENSGNITSSYSTGNVSDIYDVGGFVGWILSGSITSGYSTRSITSSYYVIGGLVGENSGNITSSYSTGSVRSSYYVVGGLVGDNGGTITSSFWDIETSGQAESDGGTGLTTAEMQNRETFIEVGWDFVDETDNGTCNFWAVQDVNYPRLAFLSGYSVAEPKGSGTQDDPYILSDANDLGTVWYRPQCSYRLDADIDLADIKWGSAVIPGFDGQFNGNGHVIRNLVVEGGSYLGLFGRCKSGANISDLGLEAVDVNGTGDYIGGLVGYNYYFSTITSSYSTGNVRGGNYVGGLVGYNDYSSIITSSYSTDKVSGSNYVGGLVGYNDYSSTITSNYSTSNVSGGNYVGGLVGHNFYSSTISSSYSTGKVSGSNYVGGLVGYNYFHSSTITSSYSTSSVSGDNYVGGLVGWNSQGLITSCVWDTETSDREGSDGGVGLTTSEMMDAEMLGLNGFASDPNWILDSGHNYPRLVWEKTVGEAIPEPVVDWLSGSGTQADPYQIESVSQLLLLSKAGKLMDQCFDLADSLDLSGLTWSQAVLPYFNGRFNGKGHIIDNLAIEGQRHLGFFGILGPEAEIRNLGLRSVEIDGTGGLIGGLVGYNTSGSIAYSYSNGNVTGAGNYVGGLVGDDRDGDITSSTSTGSVTGHDYVGGLVGDNWNGNITSSSSIGSVCGNSRVGGLLGNTNSGSITSSTSNGNVTGTGNYVGGLVGLFGSGTITSSISGGTVTGTGDYVGGLVGYNSGTIRSNSSTDSVSGSSRVGGLVGYNGHGDITLSTCSGSVTGTGDKIGGLVGYIWYGNIKLSASSGNVTGGSVVGGLVGGGYSGSITSCTSSGSASGIGDYIGGLVGDSWFSITSCSSTGNVSGSSVVGGLVGHNNSSIRTSYCTGSVNGSSRVGGFVGYNTSSSIMWSYSTGNVRGESAVGGLVGYNSSSSIMSSYSIGNISGNTDVGGLVGYIRYNDRPITSSFWDIYTSGLSESAGGIGLGTLQMQNINTYLNAGWDFVGETANGIDDIWWMPTNGYPRLWWEQ